MSASDQRPAAAAARPNYWADIGPRRAGILVEIKRAASAVVDPATGCHLMQGFITAEGYAQIWVARNRDLETGGPSSPARHPFLLHVVAYMAANSRAPRPGLAISHRCGRGNCFNPDHLVEESREDRASRQACPGPVICPAHGHLIVDLCAHSPRCIRPARPDVRCCLVVAAVGVLEPSPRYC